ncbi:hypothetical protein FHT32_001246 [Variovorax sp. SG517]|uniref:hypothetical protein n=1 Tax=Variovorax sp. SG517 TaxID=2587117 RepID=UPI00159E9724|nr:hypothetical protein [Variovorax sp. SG517]NVM87607.1 hypothetical protein [Variovorax sp. SG517]
MSRPIAGDGVSWLLDALSLLANLFADSTTAQQDATDAPSSSAAASNEPAAEHAAMKGPR